MYQDLHIVLHGSALCIPVDALDGHRLQKPERTWPQTIPAFHPTVVEIDNKVFMRGEKVPIQHRY